MNQLDRQRELHNKVYATGSREHVISGDLSTSYIVSWRVRASLERLLKASKGQINSDSTILILCSGEGMEGSILCDLGFTNVSVSDLAELGVRAALKRDARLKGFVLNAQMVDLPDGSFDVVMVHDGLHHLPSPVQGFTEMLRVAKKAVVFLEPHDSIVGRLIGTQWERNGSAINYVFRWNRRLVEQVTSGYLGPDAFDNLSFSFWHHNLVFAKITQVLGGARGLPLIKIIKRILDLMAGKYGNQFCGMVLKR